MSILANAQAAIRLLGREPVDLQEVRAILEDIAQQDKQAASVIARLRSFLREGESRFEPLALETVLRDALALGRSAVAFSGVDVETQIATGLPRVRGDHVQLLQVMLNLLVNGCESMSAVPAPNRRLRLEIGPKGREHVEVMIADRGIGLPAGDEDRVFDPFFTTKGKGLGLGLAIGRSIASAHGGRLWGENNPHGGATFHLVLPTDGGHGGRAALDRNR
jgi:two-component system sensor kinase FixL